MVVEVVALLVDLVIIKRILDADRFVVAWVAVVVGVHFFGLGSLWRDRPLDLVGAVLAALGWPVLSSVQPVDPPPRSRWSPGSGRAQHSSSASAWRCFEGSHRQPVREPLARRCLFGL
ncbi:MAG: hypothetical protein M3460_20040 [Actinomycetota bacterium]|nr:hypothetical protein [Actinomycetota bacterium]